MTQQTKDKEKKIIKMLEKDIQLMKEDRSTNIYGRRFVIGLFEYRLEEIKKLLKYDKR
jgi:hypothetical protein